MFPEVEQPSDSKKLTLKDAIKDICYELRLQATDWFVDKVIQLYEMILVRHGIMIVGDPMSCKTQCIRVLAESLNRLAENDGED